MPIHNQFLLVNNAINPLLLTSNGPVLQVEVELPTPLANQYQTSGATLPSPVTGLALVDTGAAKTCVDADAIAVLGVPPINRVLVQTPSGSQHHYLYPAKMSFPGTPLPSIDFSSVIGATLAAQGIVVLIGRDVLQRFLLVYNGPAGMFSLGL